jgi:hypothetical protein
MSRIRSFVTANAKAFIVAAIILVGGAIYVASLPKAGASGGYVCSYYSDATYRTVVGSRGTGCCGEPINWGVTTAYKKCRVLICTDQICPN